MIAHLALRGRAVRLLLCSIGLVGCLTLPARASVLSVSSPNVSEGELSL